MLSFRDNAPTNVLVLGGKVPAVMYLPLKQQRSAMVQVQIEPVAANLGRHLQSESGPPVAIFVDSEQLGMKASGEALKEITSTPGLEETPVVFWTSARGSAEIQTGRALRVRRPADEPGRHRHISAVAAASLKGSLDEVKHCLGPDLLA